MKKSFILFAIILLFPLIGHAIHIDRIIVFGDSLTDNGNIYSFTSLAHKITSKIPVVPKTPPYYQGRFTNGPIWAENLAKKMSLDPSSSNQFVDYALGGSWAEPYNDSKQIFPFDFATEVGNYLTNALLDFHKDKHLYAIWIGGNDYLSGRDDYEHATNNTVNIIKNQVERLIRAGAKNILILNLPDLSVTPWSILKGPEFSQKLSQLSLLHNSKLATILAELKQNNPSVKIIAFNIMDQFNDVFLNPEKYHIKDLRSACYNNLNLFKLNSEEIEAAKEIQMDIINNPSLQVAYATGLLQIEPCSNPDDFLFWDQVHPSQLIHQVIANAVFQELNLNDVHGG